MNRPFWTQPRQPEPDVCDTIGPMLSLYADGMASPDESRRIEAHLPGCDSCRRSLNWMQATRAALASRPVVPPPAALQARIARSIAALPAAAPVVLRPARAFTLRPAYAAAASLTVVAAVVGYSLLHSHPAVVTPGISKPPQAVAIVPPVEAPPPQVAPLVKPSSGHSGSKPLPVKHFRPSVEHLASNDSDTPNDMTAPVTPKSIENTAPLVKPQPRSVIRKKPTLPKPDAVMAKSPKPAPTENHAPLVKTPEVKPPDTVVATAHVPPSPNPVNVSPAPQETAPVMTASNNTETHARDAGLMDAVREHVGQMQTASFSPVKFARTSSAMEEKFVMGAIAYSSPR